MPKAKKSSKPLSSKDTAAFIKKVASAGRGGDTELAYLSSTARELLKKLGGAGTKNPKTKLKEYKPASRFAREPKVSAEELLAELNRLNRAAAQPQPAPAAAVAPTQPEATASPLSVRPAETTAPLFPTQTVQTPPPGRAAVQEEREPVARPGSAAQDMATMRAAEERAAQEAARQQAAQQEAARQQAAQAAARQQAEQTARAAQEAAARQQAEREAQAAAAQQAEVQRRRAQEARAQEDLVRTRREEEGRRAEEQRRLAEAEAARRAQEQAAAQAAAQEAARQEAARQQAAELVRQQERERTAALIRQQEERERAPRTEESETITTRGSAADDLTRVRNREDLANRPDITNVWKPYGDQAQRIAQEEIERRGAQEAARRAEEEAARRAAEEEANRRAAEEAAKRAAEEAAARKAAEDAARQAAEQEAARKAAEEQARRREEEARRIAEQDAQARRAAEEARRVAEEAEKRRLADEAARKAAEEEARRRAEEEKNRGPGTGGPGTGGPGAGGPGTGGPGGGGVKPPPGLIDSPLPTTPPPATQPPPSGGGIQPPPTTGGGTVPGGGPVRTHDFIDRNLNGIDDRDEEPSRGGGGFNFGNIGNFFGEDTDIGRLIGRIGGGRGGGGGGGKPSPGGGGGGKIPELPPTGGGLPSRPELPPTGGGPPARPGPAPGSPPDFGGGGGFYTPTPGVTPGYQAAPLPVMPGAGTGTSFFNPNTGGLTPGTIPTGQTPTSLLTSNIPLQALGQNPNLGPTMLGGAENAGYYTDRFGNVILSPGAVRPGGRKKGGPASDAELLQLLQEQNEAEGYRDIDSARSMLDQLMNEPASSKTEVSLSPTSQSVRRTSRRPIRQETDRGSARGMAMEFEEVTKTQGPRTKRQTEDMRQQMELIRNTLGIPTLTKASLAREGDLMARRFNEGGDVTPYTMANGGSIPGRFFGGFGPEVVPRGDALSRRYGSENPGTQNFVNPSLTLSDAIKFLRNPDAEEFSDAIAASAIEQEQAKARQNRGLRVPEGGAVGGGRGGGLPYGGPTSYAGMYESPRKKSTVTVEEIPQSPQGMNKGGEAKSSAREKLDELVEYAGRGARKMKRGAAELLGVADIPGRAERESVAAFGVKESGGGKADAMRHLMYQADLTRKFNPTTANIVSRLYELTSPGQSSAEYEMDLYNDALGREIGQRAKDEQDVVRLAREYVEKNKAKILPKEERTGYARGGAVKRKKR